MGGSNPPRLYAHVQDSRPLIGLPNRVLLEQLPSMCQDLSGPQAHQNTFVAKQRTFYLLCVFAVRGYTNNRRTGNAGNPVSECRGSEKRTKIHAESARASSLLLWCLLCRPRMLLQVETNALHAERYSPT